MVKEIEDQQNYIQTQIDIIEASGEDLTAEFYNDLIALEQAKLDRLNDQLTALEQNFADAMASGQLEEYTDDWFSMCEEIQSVKQAIIESTLATIEWKNQIIELFRQIEDHYDDAIKRVDHAQNMLEGEMQAAQYLAHRSTGDITAELIYNEKTRQTLLRSQINELYAELDKQMANGDIKKYDDHYNEIMEVIWESEEQILEAQNNINQYQRDEFDSIESLYSQKLNRISSKASLLNSQISAVEARGYVAGANFYSNLIANQEQQISMLEEQQSALESYLGLLVATGQIQVGSMQWYEMKSAIDGITTSIAEANAQIAQYEQKIRELKYEQFDYSMELINDMNKEAQFLIQLAEYNDELVQSWGKSYRSAFGDLSQMDIPGVGGLTDSGWVAMGLHAQQYATYMDMAARYAEERSNIEAQLASDPYNKELLGRKRALIEAQQESILNQYAERDAIKSLVQDGINAELEGLKELINYYEDSLESAQDLYSYQKKIEKQTKNIASIEKRLNAYQGDDSEETRKTIQELKQDLIEAQENLEETQYNQYVSDQKKLLSKLYDDYEMLLNQRLDDIDGLISEVIDNVVNGSNEIYGEIQSMASDVNYVITDNTTRVWDNIIAAKDTLNGDITTGVDILRSALGSVTSSIVDFANQMYSYMQAQITADAARDILAEMQANSEAWWESDATTQEYLHQRNNALAKEYEAQTGNTLSFDSGSGYWKDSAGNRAYSVNGGTTGIVASKIGIGPTIIQKVNEMKANSAAWTPETGAALAEKNKKLAKDIENLTGVHVYRKDDGVWYFGSDDDLLYKHDFSKYHTGGVVGDSLAANEQWAKLLKGEFVLTEDMMNRVMRITSLANTMSAGVMSGANSTNNITYNISLPNVYNYEDFANALTTDKRFTGFLQSVTTGPMGGKPSITRNKYSW